ncbi:hypothetical protein MHN79_04330 [Vibrio sp. Of14-4]|uniref:imm11 family protein n=1 Tax=Vibrio sp. Of14-4 TaxID=2724878 RepID=UPI001EF36658|nr:DUF1629 domain-containing protein [Vibrio sp. Of14-4]MCG7488713.1 hypothetical protein [Vibrio sp. Of14-4]
MKDYNEDYYLLFANPDYEEYDIEPDDSSARRNYDSEELDFGHRPIIFTTETPDLSFANGEYEVFFPIGSIVVSDKLKVQLENGLYGAKFYPAVVKGEDKGIRDDVWVLNVFEPLDCWDREKSVAIYPGGVKSLSGISVLPSIKSFYLSKEILDNIPEEDRLLFVMDNTDVTNIFVHKKVVDIFNKNNIKNINFLKVSQYKFGMEFI